MISERLPHTLRVEPTIVASALGIAVSLWGLPLAAAFAGQAFPILVASRLSYGATTVVCGMQVISLQQQLTPDAHQGRMYATVRFVINLGATLGALGGGIVGQAVGVTQAMAMGAAGCSPAVPLLLAMGPARNAGVSAKDPGG